MNSNEQLLGQQLEAVQSDFNDVLNEKFHLEKNLRKCNEVNIGLNNMLLELGQKVGAINDDDMKSGKKYKISEIFEKIVEFIENRDVKEKQEEKVSK